MGAKSKIEWTDATWNTVYGCTRVSPGCDHCYAVRQTQRLAGTLDAAEGLVNDGKKHFNGTVRLLEDRLDQPLRWKAPKRIFVNSLSDLFHPGVPFEFVDRVFAVMALCRQHTFQVLTKRPERMREYLTKDGIAGAWAGEMTLMGHPANPDVIAKYLFPAPNVWLMTSVEDQAAADERIPHLLQTPAAVRGISMEPLLGAVDVAPYLDGSWGNEYAYPIGPILDWVIVGGESGPGARPMHPEWVRSLRDQCHAARAPFFFKQWGAWAPNASHGMLYPEHAGKLTAWTIVSSTDKKREGEIVYHANPPVITERACGVHETMRRVGKKAAGRELDGRTWEEWPNQNTENPQP